MCCCQWGAAKPRSQEWPEFPCWYCPDHGYEPGLSSPTELCKRHRSALLINPDALRKLNREMTPSPPDEISEAIASIRKDQT